MSAGETKATEVEAQKNCAACGKPVKKLKRYYNRGKYYCSRKCYLKFKKQQKQKQSQ